MKYFGTKSLDAEIYLDLVKGEIQMDYSLNSVVDPMNLHSSEIYDNKNEYFTLPRWKKLVLSILFLPTFLYFCFISVETGIITRLSQFGLFPAKYQYAQQNFLKNFLKLFRGIYIEEFEGKLSGMVLQILIARNIWVGYELEGDYEKYITNIAFERKIRKFKKYNQYNLFIQDGWVLTFEFSQPPKTGSCKVEYV